MLVFTKMLIHRSALVSGEFTDQEKSYGNLIEKILMKSFLAKLTRTLDNNGRQRLSGRRFRDVHIMHKSGKSWAEDEICRLPWRSQLISIYQVRSIAWEALS